MKTIKLIVPIILLLVLFESCAVKSKKGIVISRLEKVSKFSTTKVVISKYVYDKKNRFIKDRFFLAHTEATIKFGVDLSKIKGENVIIKGDEISLILPPVEITNLSYPSERFFVDTIISDEKALEKFGVQEIDELYCAAQTQIEESIEYMGLRKTAEERTTKMIKQLCKGMGFSVVDIEFETPTTKAESEPKESKADEDKTSENKTDDKKS